MTQHPIKSAFSYDQPQQVTRKDIVLRLGFVMLALALTAQAQTTVPGHAQSTQQPTSSPSPAAEKGNDVRGLELEQGKPIERELAGGEVHAYGLALAAGQYAQVVVDQRRINVAMTAFDSEGKKIVEADMFSIGDSESVSFLAETSTSYRLEVRSPDKTAPKGRYEIKIKTLRVATEQDKSLVAAERLFAEGGQLASQLTADSWRKAIEKYQQSIPLCRSAKDPAWEATALYLISNAYIELGEKQKALDFSGQALPLAQAAAKLPDEEQRRLGIKVEANTLDTIGRVHIQFGDKKKALELFNQALPLRRAIGDRVGEINTINNIGMAHGYMGEWAQAIDFFSQVRLLVSELGDRRKEASVLNNLCVIQSNLGEYKKALDSCNQALLVRQDLNDRSSEATTLDNIGTIYSSLGEYQQALDYHNKTLAIYRDVGNREGVAIALNNIGWVYGTLGEYQKAIDIYNQAVEIFRAAGDRYRESNSLNNIGANYADLGEYRKALDIQLRVLSIRRAVNDHAGEAVTLNNIAFCYSKLGQKQNALDYYDQAVKLHRAVGNPRQLATALRNIGVVQRDSGEYQKALDYLNEALQLSEKIGDKNGEAGELAEIARLERDRGNVVEARSRIESALAAIESLRINVKSQQLRTSFLASVRKYYEFEVDVLMRLHKERPTEGFDAAALEASERGRARSLLESLSEARAEIRQGVSPLLLDHERQLRQAIGDRAERQMRLLSGAHTEAQATALAREIDTLTSDYEQVQTQIRQTSPRYAALTQPAPLGLKQIQQQVLDDESLLLEYALGEDRSFVWVVTPHSIKSFELPKRTTIEEAARRVYESLTARGKSLPNETLEQKQLRIDLADAEYPRAASALSQILLGPMVSELGKKRLLVVSEGALQYVPVGALPDPKDEGGRMKDESANPLHPSSFIPHPLIVDHEIVSLPSASVLAALRQEASNRKPAMKAVAVLADPVFSRDDSRVSRTGRSLTVQDQSLPADVLRSAEESGLRDFVRLRFSRAEADAIARLVPGGQRLEAVDFVANRATATSADLDQYRIVHFATHGLINSQHPELSGIVLSLVDQEGQQQNGFLRLYEIYNLRLNAELVVLSACQTALGKEIKGEGLIGLTRAFMYAGAPRVVASLWRIDDRATAELMTRFYRGMLKDGLRPAAALRAAQVSMWKENRWSGPHYWAAFTIQGEWK